MVVLCAVMSEEEHLALIQRYEELCLSFLRAMDHRFASTDVPEIVALRDRLVGSVYLVELIMERGRRFESSEIKGKRFRCKIVIDGLQLNRGWWYLSCDTCNSKAYEEGSTYRCGNDKCSNKSVDPRLGLLVVPSGDMASVEMVFFGDLARDLVGNPGDLLVAENYGLISTIPKDIATLTGRRYIVDVSVSRYSFHVEDITFQVIKFYPEDSLVFVGLSGWPLPGAAGVEAARTMPLSVGSSGLQEIGSGSRETGG